jgi:hypothetical protein
MRIVKVDQYGMESLFSYQADRVGIQATVNGQAEIRQHGRERFHGLVVFGNQQCAK